MSDEHIIWFKKMDFDIYGAKYIKTWITDSINSEGEFEESKKYRHYNSYDNHGLLISSGKSSETNNINYYVMVQHIGEKSSSVSKYTSYNNSIVYNSTGYGTKNEKTGYYTGNHTYVFDNNKIIYTQIYTFDDMTVFKTTYENINNHDFPYIKNL